MSESSIIAVGIDDEYNCVFIELTNEDDVDIIIKHLKNEGLYNSETLYFEVDPKATISTTANIANGGESIFHWTQTGSTINIMSGTISANVICNETGRLGVLTNVHVAPLGTSMVYGEHYDPSLPNYFTSFINIGTTLRAQFGRLVDAAFIPFNNQGHWEITHYGRYDNTTYNNVKLGNESQNIRGQLIMRIGQTTGVTNG